MAQCCKTLWLLSPAEGQLLEQLGTAELGTSLLEALRHASCKVLQKAMCQELPTERILLKDALEEPFKSFQRELSKRA